MKLLDANLLLYSVNADSPLHREAKHWIEEQLSGSETIAFAWVVLLAFLRISTRAVVFVEPLEPAEAFGVVDAWLSQPCATVVQPTDRHARVLRDLLLPLGTAGNLTMDAHLAALAIEHGAELCSTDMDFARFPALHWQNPLFSS